MEGVPFVGNDACAHNLLLKGRPLIMRSRQVIERSSYWSAKAFPNPPNNHENAADADSNGGRIPGCGLGGIGVFQRLQNGSSGKKWNWVFAATNSSTAPRSILPHPNRASGRG